MTTRTDGPRTGFIQTPSYLFLSSTFIFPTDTVTEIGYPMNPYPHLVQYVSSLPSVAKMLIGVLIKVLHELKDHTITGEILFGFQKVILYFLL